jgi:acetylornithine deacetylase/succinyl-diaminopimelate desuccinylase-like protein
MTPTQLLTDLVRLPSLNPMNRVAPDPALFFEHRVTDYLEGVVRGLGVPHERQPVAPHRSNLVARFEPPGPAPFTVLFEVHQDTVPVDQMTIDPFGAAIAGGRLSGRGACDVKGGMAAMLAAFARLVREKPRGAARVILAFTVDEEHTFLGVQRLVRDGRLADFAVVAEPTNLQIVKAHKGVVRWHLTAPGRSCHSSRPDLGDNAIYRMGRLLGPVDEYARTLLSGPADPLLGPPTLSVGRIEGGTSVNTVPDFCRVEIDRRLIPGEQPAEAPKHFEASLRHQLPGEQFHISEPWLYCPALAADGSEEAVRRLGAAIDTVAGPHRVTVVPFGTDASTVALSGVPSVVFGPGDIAQAHTCDEWIDLAQLDAASEILFRLATSG